MDAKSAIDDGVAEYNAICVAFKARDIGECLRLLTCRLERFRAELRQLGLDSARRAELKRDIRIDEFTRRRLLV